MNLEQHLKSQLKSCTYNDQIGSPLYLAFIYSLEKVHQVYVSLGYF